MRIVWRVVLGAVLVASSVPVRAQLISGGGEAFIAGGAGNPPIPLKNTFAFRIDRAADGTVSGSFDCLAIAPAEDVGPLSGQFTKNVMYVTGKITSLDSVSADTASFSGTATVTGVGAGSNLPFSCHVTPGPAAASAKSGVGVTPGGAGATMTLAVSGLVFDEVLTNGAIRFNVSEIKKLAKKK